MVTRFAVSLGFAYLAVVFIVGSTLPNNLCQFSYQKSFSLVETVCKKLLKWKREIGITGYLFATAHLLAVIPFSMPTMSMPEMLDQYQTGLISWLFFTAVFSLSFPRKFLVTLTEKERIRWRRFFMYPGLVASLWHCLHVGAKLGRYSPIIFLLTISLTAIIFRWWSKKKRIGKQIILAFKK